MSFIYTGMPYIDRAFATDKYPKGGFHDGSLHFIPKGSNINGRETVFAMLDRFLQKGGVTLIDSILAFGGDDLSPFSNYPDYPHSLEILRGSYWYGGHEEVLRTIEAADSDVVIIYGYDEGAEEPIPEFARWFEKLERLARQEDLPILMFQKGTDSGASRTPSRLNYRNAKY